MCSIVSLHVLFVNSEAAVQRCYKRITILKILESFQGETRGEVLFQYNSRMRSYGLGSQKTCMGAGVWAKTYK